MKQPLDNLVLSNTARAGVVTFCKSVANSVGEDGITVNVVCPGHFKTQRSIDLLESWAEDAGASPAEIEAQQTADVPVKRYGNPGELADVITFLASERAGFVTGTPIQVDGGAVKGI